MSPAMHTIQYKLLSCRLNLLGQGAENGDNSSITELKQFTLELDDHVSLVGNLPHLKALAETLLPYARHIISGQVREYKSADGKISVTPWHRGHRLQLRNENGNTRSDVQLDDGELANMVRCLDAAIQDPRFQLDIAAPPMQGLRERELLNRLPLRQRLAAPLGGLALAMALVGLGFLVPVPERFRVTDSEDQQSEDQQEDTTLIETVETQVVPVESEPVESEPVESELVELETETPDP